MATNRRGFTIVELLIVIVVIAVLAAISVVAYNGIQTRANQAANFVAIKNYVQAFSLVRVQTGTFPPGQDNNASCLGPLPHPGSCAIAGQFSSASSTSNTRTLLEQYGGLTTQPGMKGAFTHLVYTVSFYGEPALIWQVAGSQDCTPTAGRFNVYPNWTDNVRYSTRSSSVTECTLSLRDA